MLSGNPTSTLAAVETMDFSLPSYSDAIGGSVKSSSETPTPSIKPLEIPEISLPSLSLPKVEIPGIEKSSEDSGLQENTTRETQGTKSDMAKLGVAKFSIPKAPKVAIPDFNPSNTEMPSFDASKLGVTNFQMPKFDVPKVETPNFDISTWNIPKIDGLKVPEVDVLSKVPNVKLSVPNPFSKSDGVNEDMTLEPQEDRDKYARETRKDFLIASEDVKEAEKVLQALKEVKKVKKAIAAEAKDIACADRPGGKFICLRNPFITGF